VIRPFPIAFLLLVGLMVAAFAGAQATQDLGLLSLIPPASEAVPNPAADTDDPLALGQAAYTAWVALSLLIPAYAAILLRGAGRTWLAFWSAAWVAYAVHLYVSAFWFFGGDLEWMQNTTRVSAFWPGMVLLVWWPVDIALGVSSAQGALVKLQRIVLHVGSFVLFFGGSAVMGELTAVKVLGGAFALVVIGALVVQIRRRSNGV